MNKTTDLPPLYEDASEMLDTVLEHLSILADLRAVAQRHNGVLPSAYAELMEGGGHCRLGGINMRLWRHADTDGRNDARFEEAAAQLDVEKMPILETIERLEEKDAPLADRLGAHEALADAYARALSAIVAN